MNCFACSAVFFDQRRLCCTPPLVRFQQPGMASHKVVCTDVMTYTAIYTYIQCIHISPCYIVLSSAAGVIGNIGLGLANQGTSHPTRHRRPAPAQSQSIVRGPSASAKVAPSLAWLPLRAVPLREPFALSTKHSIIRRPHARARHYHQLDRCHRRRQKTIIHHRPTLTSSLSVCRDTPHSYCHSPPPLRLRCSHAPT
jgi:hypothetical protein